MKNTEGFFLESSHHHISIDIKQENKKGIFFFMHKVCVCL